MTRNEVKSYSCVVGVGKVTKYQSYGMVNIAEMKLGRNVPFTIFKNLDRDPVFYTQEFSVLLKSSVFYSRVLCSTHEFGVPRRITLLYFNQVNGCI